MSRLEEASTRLQAAIDRLERAAASRASNAQGDVGDLQAALDQARRENAALQEIAQTVSKRLDSAIDRLNLLLET